MPRAASLSYRVILTVGVGILFLALPTVDAECLLPYAANHVRQVFARPDRGCACDGFLSFREEQARPGVAGVDDQESHGGEYMNATVCLRAIGD